MVLKYLIDCLYAREWVPLPLVRSYTAAYYCMYMLPATCCYCYAVCLSSAAAPTSTK